MAMWNPWHGCHRCSDGCQYCYIHKGDRRRGVDTDQVFKTADFDKPLRKNKNGTDKIKSGQTVYTCFSSDFLLPDADPWRSECWEMMRRRKDLHFLFLTKRIHRFMSCIPDDWGDGYENVTVGCTVENQTRADERLKIFNTLPIKHKNIICQPMIAPISLKPYLSGVELVVVGGESDPNARVLDYDWVLSLREECIRQSVAFEFRQCGTYFCKEGKLYHLKTSLLCSQARKANINWSPTGVR